MQKNPFAAIRDRLKPLADLPQRIAAQCAMESLLLYNEGFDLQQDPYGQKWPPTVTGLRFDKRDGLRRAAVQHKSPLKFYLTVQHVAFQFHQGGTVFLPPRLMVPEAGRGLGRWGARYKQVTIRLWHEAWR